MEADAWLTFLVVVLIVNVHWDTEEPRVGVGCKFTKDGNTKLAFRATKVLCIYMYRYKS